MVFLDNITASLGGYSQVKRSSLPNSKYRKMASDLALNNPELIKTAPNFDLLFKTRSTQNLFPLLAKYDQFIEYHVQRESYKGYLLKKIDYGPQVL